MSRAAVGTRESGNDEGAEPEGLEPATLGIEIQFYRPDEPITIPLPEFDPARAQAYFEGLKSDVIEAQLHSDSRISIEPAAAGHEVLVLDPMTIKQVLLVDGTQADEPRTDEVPAVDADGDDDDDDDEVLDPGVLGTELPPELQRRIDIMLE